MISKSSAQDVIVEQRLAGDILTRDRTSWRCFPNLSRQPSSVDSPFESDTCSHACLSFVFPKRRKRDLILLIGITAIFVTDSIDYCPKSRGWS